MIKVLSPFSYSTYLKVHPFEIYEFNFVKKKSLDHKTTMWYAIQTLFEKMQKEEPFLHGSMLNIYTIADSYRFWKSF